MASPASYRPKTGSIPTQPGVYRFRDATGRVIYVGKAKNLRARLSSYFQDVGNLHARTATMVTTGASVEWTVVKTEVEALQLEYSWIKERRSRSRAQHREPYRPARCGDGGAVRGHRSAAGEMADRLGRRLPRLSDRRA